MDGQCGVRLCWLRRLRLGFGKLPAALALATAHAAPALAALALAAAHAAPALVALAVTATATAVALALAAAALADCRLRARLKRGGARQDRPRPEED
jgi:hypothetical protein